MPQIDDTWKRVIENPKFEALPEERKEVARQRFYERYVASAASYQGLTEERRNAVRDQFNQRITIPGPKPSPLPGQIKDAAVEGAKQAGSALATAGNALTTGVVDTAKEVGGAALELRDRAQKATKIPAMESLSKTVEKVTPEILHPLGVAASLLLPETPTMEGLKQAGAETVGELAGGMVPKSWEEVGEYLAFPALMKMAGKTFLGLPVKEALGLRRSARLADRITDDFSNILTSELIESEMGRTANPARPLERISAVENIVKPPEMPSSNALQRFANTQDEARYLKWLETHTEEEAQKEFPDLYPAMKTNLSMMRDEAKVRLQRIQAEGLKLRQVWEAEQRAKAPPLLPAPEGPAGLLPEQIKRPGIAHRQKGYIPLGESTLAPGEGTVQAPKTAPTPAPEIPKAAEPPAGPAVEPPSKISLGGEGKPESLAPGTELHKKISDLLRELNEDLGERGSVGPGEPIDPARQARLQENARDLIRRAREAGIESTEEIMQYAAAHAHQTPLGKILNEHIEKTVNLSPVEEWPSKELESAAQGNPTAKASILERAQEKIRRARFSKKASHELVWKKAGDENTLGLEAYYARHDALAGMTDTERHALSFVVQKKLPPLEIYSQYEPNAAEILEQAKHPTELMSKAVKIFRNHEDDMHRLMNEVGDKVDYLEDYLHQSWERADTVANWIDSTRGASDPFAKQRTFATWADGMEAGHKPKPGAIDMRANMATTDKIRTKLINRYRIRTWLENAKTFDGEPAMLPETEAPPEYQRMDHKAFQTEIKDPDGTTRTVRLAVSPDYKSLIKMAFERNSIFPGFRETAMFNAIRKQTNLAVSLFHGQTLVLDQTLAGMRVKDALGLNKKFPWIHPSESSPWRMVAGIGKSVKAGFDLQPLEDVKNMGDFHSWMKRAYKGYLEGNPILQNRELALDAAEHGVIFDAMPDLEYNILSRALRSAGEAVAKVHPNAALPFKVTAGAVDVQLKTIFTYIRNMGAMITYENHLADNLKAFPEMPVEQVKSLTGQFVGKMFGGVAFTALMASPKMVQLLHLTQFAPDWFWSTWLREKEAIRGASQLATGGFKDPQARQATLWAARLALGYAVVGNMVNYAMWKKYTGKGRFLHENEEGHKLDVFMGYYPNEKDPSKPGRIRWMVPGRGFTDPYDLYTDWKKYFRSRVSPAVRDATKILTGMAPGGYVGPKMSSSEQAIDYLKQTRPFSLTDQTEFFTYPTRKGMGYSKAKDLFLESFEKGDPKFKQQAIKWGHENHLSGAVLESAYNKAQQEYMHDRYQKAQKNKSKGMFQ